MDFEDIYSEAQTAKGSRELSVSELEASLIYFRERNAVIQSMEAFRVVGLQVQADLSYSILGLDGGEDWEQHRDIDRAYRLVQRKIEGAKTENHEYLFIVWIVNDKDC